MWTNNESGTWWPAIVDDNTDQGQYCRHNLRIVKMHVQIFIDDTIWLVSDLQIMYTELAIPFGTPILLDIEI